MSNVSAFLNKLGIAYPIIQAPMAGVSTPALAAAVSNAGGLGSLGIGASTTEQAQMMIQETKSLTDRPFNVNVFCHAHARRDPEKEAAWLSYLRPLFEEAKAETPKQLDEIYKTFLDDEQTFEMLLDTKPSVVSFHFGFPSSEKIAAFKSAGIFTMATATNLAEARQIEDAGIDAIVAQGIEAGGHRGVFDPNARDEQLSTAVLVQMIVRSTRLPVIAAGGIMDGKAIKAMLTLGASAAQLGTAFILCPESAANENYRNNLRSDRAYTTRLTPTISGRPARGMVNRFIKFAHAPLAPLPPDYPVAYDAAKQLNAAATKLGNHEFAAQWAGQAAALSREMPAAELMATLISEIQVAQ